MKKNNKGFFLAETIVVLALVTTVMAFVYPNVSKLYDNYSSRINYYDQTEDVLILKEIYNAYQTTIDNLTYGCCGNKAETDKDDCNNSGSGKWMAGAKRISNMDEIKNEDIPDSIKSNLGIDKLYITSYMSTPSDGNYNFNRYLKRLRKVTNDVGAYRLIGIFSKDGEEKYASIKITTSTTCGINN